jgi:beta-lactamase class A
MRRAAFVAGSLAACTLPRAVSAQPSVYLRDVLNRIPGITGVFVRTMVPGPALFTWRPNEQFASASVIKLAIMATVYRAYDAGTAHPHDTVRTRADDLIGGSDVLRGYPAGKAWSLDTLVKAMIHVSDNSASNTLMTAFGLHSINATMQLAGMTSSRLARHFADVVPPWRKSQNIVTPNDVATLLYSIEKGSREGVRTIASAQSCRAMINVMLGNDDHSKIVRGLPKGTPVAHKTGEIDGVRNDAGIIDPFGDDPYILVVLTRELSDISAGDAGIAAIARRIDTTLRRAAN